MVMEKFLSLHLLLFKSYYNGNGNKGPIISTVLVNGSHEQLRSTNNKKASDSDSCETAAFCNTLEHHCTQVQKCLNTILQLCLFASHQWSKAFSFHHALLYLHTHAYTHFYTSVSKPVHCVFYLLSFPSMSEHHVEASSNIPTKDIYVN